MSGSTRGRSANCANRATCGPSPTSASGRPRASTSRLRCAAPTARSSTVPAFGLLQHYGPESAGALTLLAPGQALPDARLEPLPDEALSARIRALPRQPLSEGAPKRMSLAGAQHKLAVVLHQDRLWEPVGRA